MSGAVNVMVAPAAAARAYRHTLSALERLCHVRFVTEEDDATRARAALLLDADAEGRAPAPIPSRRFVVAAGAPSRSRWDAITLTDERVLDARLRGRVIRDGHAAEAPALDVGAGDAVLARRGTEPVWVSRRGADGTWSDVVSVPPPELAASDTLRSHLCPGRFIGLLPLLHYLRSLAPCAWRSPPLRACLVLDDPNLRRPTYGALDFGALAWSARSRGYHVTIATIPLDAWWISRAVGRTFSDHAAWLSLCMHGNDHIRAELDQPVRLDAAVASLAQGLRRMERFERRVGLVPARVVVPPHDPRFSDTWMRACSIVGMHAGVIDHVAYLEADGASFSDRAACGLAAFGAGSFPLLNRFPIELAEEAAVLAAFLEQPVLIGGHHGDATDGLRRIEAVVEHVGLLGDVRWMGLAEVARSNYECRTEDDGLVVRPFSRRVDVPVPEGIGQVVVDVSALGSDASPGPRVSVDGVSVPVHGGRTAATEVRGAVAEISLEDEAGVDYRTVPPPPLRPWPLARRVLTEARDRLALRRR